MFGTRPQSRRRFAPAGRRLRPSCIQVESRLLLAVIPVTTTADVAEPGSLRYALDTSLAGDEIVFQISTDDNGYNAATGSWTITVQFALPPVLNSVTIDGLTQQTQPGASTSHPAIELVPGGEYSGDGLSVIGGGNTIRGLAIDGFTGIGLVMSGSGADGNLVTGNYIGTDVTGSKASPNVGGGVLVSSSNNTIGGVSSGLRNLISGNGADGVLVQPIEGNSATGNLLLGNFIGTNSSGASGIANGGAGVRLRSTGNTVGSLTSGGGNVISSNDKEGLYIQVGSNAILGNLVGVNAAGTAALGNGLSGITVQDASSNTVQGNVLSGNGTSSSGGSGIVLRGSGAVQNLVQGNLIGLNGGGTAAIPNQSIGVLLFDGATRNTVGGTATGNGNVISGNGGPGILVGSSSANSILGNTIGMDGSRSAALGNAGNGIAVFDSSDTAIRNNLISGNGSESQTSHGILLDGSGSTRNIVQGNYIGTNAAGTASFSNHGDGVLIRGGATGNSLSGNLISGNLQYGIELNGADVVSNVISSNQIGLNLGGDSALGNQLDGIAISSAANNTVGPGNVLSGNGTGDQLGSGVNINGSGATGNLVQGNYIGTDATGRAGVPNTRDGVIIQAAAVGNSISANVVSGNAQYGIELNGADVVSNVITSNRIGLNVDGDSALGNQLDGILISGAANNTVGPGNILSGNGTNGQQGAGVNITGSGASGNSVQGNYIGTDATGTRAIGNSAIGVFIGDGSVSNTIGPGNVVSGNGAGTGQGVGVYIYGSTTSGNAVLSNRIGTDRTGLNGLGGSEVGVLVYLSPNNLVQGNQVSGNRSIGIEVAGTSASGNRLFGNAVGLDSTGAGRLGNGFDGVFINNAPGNLIGGAGTGEGNFISANGSVGVQLFGAGAVGNFVRGNAIGLDVNGRQSLPNGRAGIFINAGLRANTIGGTGTGEANVGQIRPVFGPGGASQKAVAAVTSAPPAAKKFRSLATPRHAVNRARRG